MIAFTILPIMFPPSAAIEVDAEHEAVKGGVSCKSNDQCLAHSVNRILYNLFIQGE
jgi:hypothetical protein